jgi:hypothetical protein
MVSQTLSVVLTPILRLPGGGDLKHAARKGELMRRALNDSGEPAPKCRWRVKTIDPLGNTDQWVTTADSDGSLSHTEATTRLGSLWSGKKRLNAQVANDLEADELVYDVDTWVICTMAATNGGSGPTPQGRSSEGGSSRAAERPSTPMAMQDTPAGGNADAENGPELHEDMDGDMQNTEEGDTQRFEAEELAQRREASDRELAMLCVSGSGTLERRLAEVSMHLYSAQCVN